MPGPGHRRLPGIGLELAKQLATNGFDLSVAAQDSELASATRELEGLGARG